MRTGVVSKSGRPMTASQAFFSPTSIPANLFQIQDGRFTYTIYSLIKHGRFQDVISLLNYQLQTRQPSMSSLSVLAYAHYQLQDYPSAAQVYHDLVRLCPGIQEYRLYYAECLVKSGELEKAMEASSEVTAENLNPQAQKLKSQILYLLGNVAACRAIVEQQPQNDPEMLINQGCLLYKEMKFDEALSKWKDAFNRGGYRHDLAYYLALGYFHQKEDVNALKWISEIIERGIKEHPEFNISLGFDEDVKRVPNSQALHESCLVEAFNLKAAIEYRLKNKKAALEALQDMPPRNDEDLDAITLHNQAAVLLDRDPATTFDRFEFLLESNIAPEETFQNMLLAHFHFEYDEAAADLMASYPELTQSMLDPNIKEFLDVQALRKNAAEEALRRLEKMEDDATAVLRSCMTQVQEARETRDDEQIKKAITDYDACMERYLPLIMTQARIYWDEYLYDQAEKTLRRASEFANDNETWRINYGHVFYVQEKYREACQLYEGLLQRNPNSLLAVPSIVIANLCVSYIMLSQNDLAEDLMMRLEKEEDLMMQTRHEPYFHFSIVNIVIGTLYCAKGNYEFGISRVIKSLDPIDKKLSSETWLYAKKCFVSLLEILAKQMVLLKDDSFDEILKFLADCEEHGHNIVASFDPGHGKQDRRSVAKEAAKIRSLYLALY